jgi:hypothetical protein
MGGRRDGEGQIGEEVSGSGTNTGEEETRSDGVKVEIDGQEETRGC